METLTGESIGVADGGLMPESRMTASSIYENPTLADLMKQGSRALVLSGFRKQKRLSSS